jgi:hypothetical protein
MVADVLASAGIGFDCASKAEMQAVLARGVQPDRVIYAHPCKTVSHLRYAQQSNVKQTVFDNEDEVRGVALLRCGASEGVSRVSLLGRFVTASALSSWLSAAAQDQSDPPDGVAAAAHPHGRLEGCVPAVEQVRREHGGRSRAA